MSDQSLYCNLTFPHLDAVKLNGDTHTHVYHLEMLGRSVKYKSSPFLVPAGGTPAAIAKQLRLFLFFIVQLL